MNTISGDLWDRETSIRFGWMKEWHYPRLLYRDIELEGQDIKPELYITKDNHEILWELMDILEQLDFKIRGIKYIVLRLYFSYVEDNFNIEFYSSDSAESMKTAWNIQILELNPEQIIELVKKKIVAVQEN